MYIYICVCVFVYVRYTLFNLNVVIMCSYPVVTQFKTCCFELSLQDTVQIRFPMEDEFSGTA